MTKKEQLEKKFKKFKKKYFGDRVMISGAEIEKCREEFLKTIK